MLQIGRSIGSTLRSRRRLVGRRCADTTSRPSTSKSATSETPRGRVDFGARESRRAASTDWRRTRPCTVQGKGVAGDRPRHRTLSARRGEGVRCGAGGRVKGHKRHLSHAAQREEKRLPVARWTPVVIRVVTTERAGRISGKCRFSRGKTFSRTTANGRPRVDTANRICGMGRCETSKRGRRAGFSVKGTCRAKPARLSLVFPRLSRTVHKRASPPEQGNGCLQRRHWRGHFGKKQKRPSPPARFLIICS
jgi:hypothetical protein